MYTDKNDDDDNVYKIYNKLMIMIKNRCNEEFLIII